MGYSDADWQAINTIRLLAVSVYPTVSNALVSGLYHRIEDEESPG